MGPPKRTNNDRLRCSYHKEKGHMTTSCRASKDFLEELVAAGHLGEYIDRQKTPVEQQSEVPRPDLRTINVIHGVASRQDEDHRQTEISQL